MAAVDLRPATADDLAAVCALVNRSEHHDGVPRVLTLEELEQQLIAATLRHTGYDKPRAAAMLGIGLRTLYRKIKQFGLG